MQMQNLTRNEYFNIDKINISVYAKDTVYKNFVILSILDGEGKINFNNNECKLEKRRHIFYTCQFRSRI